MDRFIDAIILGIVEGLTEFVPVSSTGHLILAEFFLDRSSASAHVFDIFIQIGAITAILWVRRARLWQLATGFWTRAPERGLAVAIIVAFLPAALMGVLCHGFIKAVLFSPLVVAISLIAGGIVMLFIEKISRQPDVITLEQVTPGRALVIGLCQVASLIPGVSRAAATIVGARFFGVSREAATDFSFFLAIPTIFGAAAFDLYKNLDVLKADDVPVFAVGTIVSFLAALPVAHFLIGFIGRYGFVPFGWYRIVIGFIVLGFLAMPPG